MSEKFKTMFWRTGLIVIEGLAVIAVLLVLAAGALTWRLTSGPLDVGFAKNYVEEALRNDERDIHATMEQVVLYWPDLKGPLLLGLRGVKVIGADGAPMMSVNEAALSLSKAHLFIGRVSPVALILKQPSLRIIRRADGKVDIGFTKEAMNAVGPPKPLEHVEEQTALTERVLDYIARPGAEPDKSSPLAKLEAFVIEDAYVKVEDYLMRQAWDLPKLNASFKSVEEGLQAELYVELPDEFEGEPHIEAEALFEWDSKNVKIAAELQDFDVRVLADKVRGLEVLKDQNVVVNAQISTTLDEELNPMDTSFQLSGNEGSFLISEYSAAPVPYKDMRLSSTYDYEEKRLSISELTVTAKDVTLRGTADLVHKEGEVRGPVKLMIDQLEHAQIDPLWPASLRGDNSEDWVVKRLSGGTFSDVFAQADFVAVQGEDGWDIDAQNLEAGFAFTDMDVDYRAPMFPVSNASGHGILDQNEDLLRVAIESGKIKDITVKKGELKFYDVIAVGKGSAEIHTEIEGPLRTAIDYVSQEPIALEHDFDLNKIKGTAAMSVDVAFPTHGDIPIEEVKVVVNGTVNDATLPGVVQGLDITGGPFDVQVKDNKLNVSGKGKLGGRNVEASYETFLSSEGKPFSSRAKARLIADPNLRAHFGANLDDFIEGSAPVNVVYTEYQSGRAEADISADLTALRAFVKPFDYEKPIGTKGAVSLKVVLQNGIAKSVKNLEATAPGLLLEKSDLAFRQVGQETELAEGTLSRFVIGETTGKVEFKIAPSTGRMTIEMNAPYLDARPFLEGGEDKSEPYTSPSMGISVSTDRMRTDEEETVQYAKIYIDIDDQGRFNQFEVDAIAGAGDVYLRFKPDETGKRVFRFEADDAGATLKAFGVYDKIIGGQMVVQGDPIRGVEDRNLLGVAEITNFKVVDAPVLAQLLSAMSLTGVLSLLDSKEGVSFSRLESRFDWLYRPGGSLLVLKDGRTSGNSLGLTFDGTFDNARGMINVSGTLVPISGLNSMIGNIPLLGDILTGGSGSVFAATYKIEGEAKKPKITVNPLAVLAPGIVRRILFE